MSARAGTFQLLPCLGKSALPLQYPPEAPQRLDGIRLVLALLANAHGAPKQVCGLGQLSLLAACPPQSLESPCRGGVIRPERFLANRKHGAKKLLCVGSSTLT
jgi:hypothetical protein